jgi:hypothetical protein
MEKQKDQASRIGGAVFLIGLGIIAWLNYWWPGIMFVIGASLIAHEWMETGGKIVFSSPRIIGAIVVVVIGLAGLIDFNVGQLWPIVLIGIGVALLLGRDVLPKNKNE